MRRCAPMLLSPLRLGLVVGAALRWRSGIMRSGFWSIKAYSLLTKNQAAPYRNGPLGQHDAVDRRRKSASRRQEIRRPDTGRKISPDGTSRSRCGVGLAFALTGRRYDRGAADKRMMLETADAYSDHQSPALPGRWRRRISVPSSTGYREPERSRRMRAVANLYLRQLMEILRHAAIQ